MNSGSQSNASASRPHKRIAVVGTGANGAAFGADMGTVLHSLALQTRAPD